MEGSVTTRRNLLVRYNLAACLASLCFCTVVEGLQVGHYSYADGGELRLPFQVPSSLYGHSFRLGDGCVHVEGVFHAGRFFHELKKKNTADGAIFRVGRRVVTGFPDQVLLEVDLLSGVPCSRDAPPGPLTPSLDSLKSLRAEAVYVRDLKKYPLEINLVSEGDIPPLLPTEQPGRLWFLQYDLNTKGVKLTDSLVITLFGKDGKQVMDLSWRM